MVRQIIAFMYSEDGFLGPINLGNPNEASLRELAETIVWLAHLKSRVECRPLPSSHPERRRLKNSRNGTDLTENLAFNRPEKIEGWSVVRSRFAYPVYDLAAVRHAAA